jgi:hypothetical protein
LVVESERRKRFSGTTEGWVAILVAQRHKKERILYILYLLMIIREKGVIIHTTKKGWSS